LQYMGCCLIPPDFFIITEFMSRGSLTTILANHKKFLSWETRRKMAMDTAKGMNYLHRHTPIILHRDLKSANLLVDENWKLKVCDFGLSRIMDSRNSMTACGTPAWVAPEVLRNQRYTEKADVFSYGVVLWELVTRQRPFHDVPAFRVVLLVGSLRYRLPIPLKCPSIFERLMKQCWAENPAVRPSFDEIVRILATSSEEYSEDQQLQSVLSFSGQDPSHHSALIPTQYDFVQQEKEVIIPQHIINENEYTPQHIINENEYSPQHIINEYTPQHIINENEYTIPGPGLDPTIMIQFSDV